MKNIRPDDEDPKCRIKDEKKFLCHVCGREMKIGDCSWQEDDEAMVCADCLAERESCGCSD